MPFKIMRRYKLLACLFTAGFVSSLTIYSKTGHLDLSALHHAPRSAPVSFSTATENLYLIQRGDLFTLRARDAALSQVIRELSAATGVEIELDPRLANTSITLDLTNRSLEDLLTQLSAGYTHTFQKEGDDYKLVSASIISKGDSEKKDAGLPARTKVDTPGLPKGVLTNLDDIEEALLDRERPLILLQNAIIDAEMARAGHGLEVPESLRASPDTQYVIVQFSDAVSEAHRKLLEGAGAEISHFVPNGAFAVRVAPALRTGLLELPGVVHVEPFHPYFKMSPEILASFSGGATDEQRERIKRGEFEVALFDGASAETLTLPAGAIISRAENIGSRQIVTVSMDPENIHELLRAESVRWVEPRVPSEVMNDLATTRVRARAVQARLPNLDGSGVIINVTDSGVDFLNPGFAIDPNSPISLTENTRIVHYAAEPITGFEPDGIPGDSDGHGTHVAGSVLGNGTLSATAVSVPGSGSAPYTADQFRGVAPAARMVVVEDFNSFSDSDQVEIAYEKGARLSNNSWGNSQFTYSLLSESWDGLVRDALPDEEGNQEYTTFFAAGNSGAGNNDGTGGNPGTIGSPANAKNVITVGAVEQTRNANNRANAEAETDTDWQVAFYSSRGPVSSTDLRIKPDIVAPGSYVISIQSRDTNPDELDSDLLPSRDYRTGNLDTGPNFASFSGTSMATPITTGAGALFYQHYTNTFGSAPSPAMMKAALVAGARNLNTSLYTFPPIPELNQITYQGWGMLDIERTIFGSSIQETDEVILLDQSATTPVGTGEHFTTTINMEEGAGGFRVVLAWTDQPGTAGNAIQLVNDLNLIVRHPSGGGYQGNAFDEDGLHSAFMSSIDEEVGDRFNNVEVVVVPNSVAGTYTIEVIGQQIPAGPQDFAVVVIKGTGLEITAVGDQVAMDLDAQGRPVIAYSGVDREGQRQIYVKRWLGEVGDQSTANDWLKMEGQWFALGDSQNPEGISRSVQESTHPAIAVHGDQVFVAWVHNDAGSTNIYLKRFRDGRWDWMAGSPSRQVNPSGLVSCSEPAVAVGADGQPIVSWREARSDGSAGVYVARWTGSSWSGFGSSRSSSIGGVYFATNSVMVANSAGRPVVAFEELIGVWNPFSGTAPPTTLRIRIYEWNGSSWVNRGTQGNAPLATRPDLAAGPNGSLFLSWIQVPDGQANRYYHQLFASRWTGSGWVAMGESSAYPGISKANATNTEPVQASITYAGGTQPKVMVAWQSGNTVSNAVLVREWMFSGSWQDTGVVGAGTPPGLAYGEFSQRVLLEGYVANGQAIPVVAFETVTGGDSAIDAFTVVYDVSPPTFAGLTSATGTTNQSVRLRWSSASDRFSTNFVYEIYQAATSYDCYLTPDCSAEQVFQPANLIARVTNSTTYEVVHLADFQLYCFGVRARDATGISDQNRTVLSAGPEPAGQDCLDQDSDGDGLPDWWELLHAGNPIVIDPGQSNSVVDVNTLTFGEAFANGTDPYATDSDGDGLIDWNEVHVHNTNPADPDTDGDGIPDGAELATGSDLRSWDSLSEGVKDGIAQQIGVTDGYDILFRDDDAAKLTGNWRRESPSLFFPNNYWEVRELGPENAPWTNENTRIGTHAWVFADYDRGQTLLAAIKRLPVDDPFGTGSLTLRWREYYDTEPEKDFIYVEARSATKGWTPINEQRSGTRIVDDSWRVQYADLSAFSGHNNIEIRFVFQANSVNNEFEGWYIEDIALFAGGAIEGWVRDINGRPVVGAKVEAVGAGGITNIIQGHAVIPPGSVVNSAISGADGRYRINALPFGSEYRVKASAPGYGAEFYNGPLFTAPYVFGAGVPENRGVSHVSLVEPKGRIAISSSISLAIDIHFELEPGEGRTHIAVAHTNNPVFGARMNNLPVNRWNGSASSPALVRYRVTNTLALVNNLASWTNAVAPNFYGELSPGTHLISLDTNTLWFVPAAPVLVREGEDAVVNVVTASMPSAVGALATNTSSLGRGYIEIITPDGRLGRDVYVNGERVPLPSSANRFAVQAGTHLLHLATANDRRTTIVEVEVPLGGVANATFTAADFAAATGSLEVRAGDAFGNDIAGATILLNGLPVQNSGTPAVISGLQPGLHMVSVVSTNGWRDATPDRAVQVLPGQTTPARFVLYQADRDHDRVGDFTEINGYTNIFLFAAGDDPDQDDLSNQMEFDLFRQFGILLDPFDPDSDGDGLSDGVEVGYNGRLFAEVHGIPHVTFARSELLAPVVAGTDRVAFQFVGRYLDGIDNFGDPANDWFVAAVDGDRFGATALTHPIVVDLSQPARSELSGIALRQTDYRYVSKILSRSHVAGATLLGDTLPDEWDTSGDGMWDGFKGQYEFMYPELNCSDAIINNPVEVHILSPLERGGGDFDPDNDGLVNFLEFLGTDGIAKTNQWTDPGNPDTDCDDMPDGWEYAFGLAPRDPGDANEDPDADDLENRIEYLVGSHPLVVDTDADDLNDYEEVTGILSDPKYRDDAFFDGLPGSTDPANPDTDNDVLKDGLEIFFGTNPNRWDTSGDGIADGFYLLDPFTGELRPEGMSLDPLDPLVGGQLSPAGDGMTNLEKFLARDGQPPGVPTWDYWLDPFSTDTDGDGMPDVFEVFYGLHPTDPIPVENGILTRYIDYSTEGDLDRDGLWNLREYQIRFLMDESADPFAMPGLSTNPKNRDTDAEGLPDGEEWHSLLSKPVNPDTSGDGLADGSGLSDRFGKVRATIGPIYKVIAAGGPISWNDAEAAAGNEFYPPPYDTVPAQLATVRDAYEYELLLEAVNEAAVDPADVIAIGGFATAGVPWTPFEWVSGEPFYNYFKETFDNFPDVTPGPRARPIFFPGHQMVDPPFVADQGVVFSTIDTEFWTTVDAAAPATIDWYVVEWRNPDERHYDEARSDLWQLVWPQTDDSDLPFWQRVVPAAGPTPSPRWGHAMTYVPGFEKKVQGDGVVPTLDGGGITLLDNRKLVVIGGRDGVEKYRDIWEYWIHSGEWRKSSQTLPDANNVTFYESEFDSGLSEHAAVLLMGYGDTGFGNLDDGSPDVRTFHPKGRPWNNGYQRSSYDLTYILGGWNQDSLYMGRNPLDAIAYKSTDDPRSIREALFFGEDTVGVAEFSSWDQTTDPSPTDNIGASAFEEPPAFAVGIGDVATVNPEAPDAGDNTIRPLTGFSALNISGFSLNQVTDEVLDAIMNLQIGKRSAVDISVDLYAEGSNPGTEYNSDFDDAEPSTRNRITGPFTFTIPAGAGSVSINITDFIRDVLVAGYGGDRLGLVFDAQGASDYAIIRIPGSSIEVEFIPSYKIDAAWDGGTSYQQDGVTPDRRKSHGMVYDDERDTIVLFGGIDGNQVLRETYHGRPSYGGGMNLSSVEWRLVETANAPSARWGHSMVYDQLNGRVLLFGGFDANNQPMNDLWEYRVDTETWQEITDFYDSERPSPRGGASIIYYGQVYYDRGADDYSYGDRGGVVLFGGTDGKRYFNDTWVFDDNFANEIITTPARNRWILAVPGGELAHGPSPRAFAQMVFAQNASGEFSRNAAGTTFAATSAAFLFGGRTGTLPAGLDTDQDLVNDAFEHGVGGPAADRDPRVDALVDTDQVGESLPFAYLRIGAFPGNLPGAVRPVIADFEVHSYNERNFAWRLGFPRGVLDYAGNPKIYPWQGHPIETTLDDQTFVLGEENGVLPPFEQANSDRYVYNMGVDALEPGWTNLWFHRARNSSRVDERNAWNLGRTDDTSAATGAVPPTPYRGRWVYGTNLRGNYPNNAVMDLFSPVLNLSIPSAQSTDPSNDGPYYLIYHEWLDLPVDTADTDHVRIDAILPATPADVLTRQKGSDRPNVTLLAPRGYIHNTTGEWRRVVVPLLPAGNPETMYIRFSLNTDGARNAGGWYIDNVAVVQGGELEGTYPGAADGTRVYLISPVDGVVVDSTVTYGGGNFGFGLLPTGSYQLEAIDSDPLNVTVASGGWSTAGLSLMQDPLANQFEMQGITPQALIQWNAEPGRRYRVQYSEDISDPDGWHDLETITANKLVSDYMDTNNGGVLRVYRILLLPE